MDFEAECMWMEGISLYIYIYIYIYIYTHIEAVEYLECWLRLTKKFTKFIIYFLDLVEVQLILRTEIGEISMEDIVTRKRATSFFRSCKNETDRQNPYRVTLWHICVIVVSMRKQKVLYIRTYVCSVSYVPCTVHDICGLSGLLHSSRLFHEQHKFWKEVTERKLCVLIFSTAFFWNISHSKKNSARYYHKSTYIFM